MRIEELEVVCREAAEQVVARGQRPLPATVVLPLPAATRVVSLPDFPDDDTGRAGLLERFAEDEMRPVNAAAYGFVVEGVADSERGEPIDVVVVVFGARNHHPSITAAALGDGAVGDFTEAEPLAPAAMPFLAPIQRAVDAAAPPDVMPHG